MTTNDHLMTPFEN